jgi:hypothetical protein
VKFVKQKEIKNKGSFNKKGKRKRKGREEEDEGKNEDDEELIDGVDYFDNVVVYNPQEELQKNVNERKQNYVSGVVFLQRVRDLSFDIICLPKFTYVLFNFYYYYLFLFV